MSYSKLAVTGDDSFALTQKKSALDTSRMSKHLGDGV